MTDGLSFEQVGEVLALIESIQCESLTIEYGNLKISVDRGRTKTAAHADPPGMQSQEADAADLTWQAPANGAGTTPWVPRVAQATHGDPGHGESAHGESLPEHWACIRAPMVGTFYRAPSPEKPPFVELGSLVEPGQTVGMIEVMKLYTELKADRAGTVASIAAEDGCLVEFGQPLVWIEPLP